MCRNRFTTCKKRRGKKGNGGKYLYFDRGVKCAVKKIHIDNKKKKFGAVVLRTGLPINGDRGPQHAWPLGSPRMAAETGQKGTLTPWPEQSVGHEPTLNTLPPPPPPSDPIS